MASVQATLSNWMNEFGKWAPSMGVVLYDGGMEERRAIRAQHLDKPVFHALVTHYDLIIRDKNALKKVPPSFLAFPSRHSMPYVLQHAPAAMATHSERSACHSMTTMMLWRR